MTAKTLDSRSDEKGSSPLRATLEVEPETDEMCGVASTRPNAAAVTRSFAKKEVCHGEVTLLEGDCCTQEYVSEPRTDGCICGTISRFDCVFDIEEITHGALVISLVLEDRDLLGQIVAALEDTGASVRLRQLSRLSTTTETTLEINATNITEKQREAVELAVELGYYDRPREATLSDLADRLDISRSAVSQRLNAVELTLIQSFTDD